MKRQQRSASTDRTRTAHLTHSSELRQTHARMPQPERRPIWEACLECILQCTRLRSAVFLLLFAPWPEHSSGLPKPRVAHRRKGNSLLSAWRAWSSVSPYVISDHRPAVNVEGPVALHDLHGILHGAMMQFKAGSSHGWSRHKQVARAVVAPQPDSHESCS